MFVICFEFFMFVTHNMYMQVKDLGSSRVLFTAIVLYIGQCHCQGYSYRQQTESPNLRDLLHWHTYLQGLPLPNYEGNY